jgi:hypothetical protein
VATTTGAGAAGGATADTAVDALEAGRLDAPFLGAEEVFFAGVLAVLVIIIYLNKYFLSVLTHNILY